jgi:hypothetical protein
MFSGFLMYFFWVTLSFSYRSSFIVHPSSVTVAFLFVFVVCGVMFVVVSVLSRLFCFSICCLCGDLNVLLGFDRAMFVDKIYLLRLEVGLGS